MEKSLYSAAVSAGVGGGIVLSGLITIRQSWRVIYYVATALTWTLTLAIIFTMPETAYQRVLPPSFEQEQQSSPSNDTKDYVSAVEDEGVSEQQAIPAKKSLVQQLRPFNGTLTQESIFKLFWRPVTLMLLPPVLWATLTLSIMVSAAVTVSANFATAFRITYNWSAWQSGLVWIANIIGALIGVGAGGWLSDKTADVLTKRNGGIREAEMRLPVITLSMISAPLSMVLYGVGIDQKLHCMVPTLAIGICKTPPPWPRFLSHQ